MTLLGTAIVRIDTDDKPFNAAIDRAQQKASGFGKVLQGVGTVAGGFLAANVISQGIGALTSGIGKAIDLASDLNEQVTKNQVIFGDSFKTIEDFANKGAKALGLSKVATFEAAGVMGNMLKVTGLAAAETSKMSTAMVTLGVDMASFNNASPEETLLALRSGLSGETEPLRRFGIFLNEAAVEAEALSMGLGKTAADMNKVKAAQLNVAESHQKYNKAVKEHGEGSIEARKALMDFEKAQAAVAKALEGGNTKLTDAEKVQARYSLIMKQTNIQQGDFARTSDGLANKQRILAAATADLQTKVGTLLLPAKLLFVNTMLAAIPIVEKIGSVLGVLGGSVIPPIISYFTTLVSLFQSLPIGIQLMLNPIAAVILNFDKLSKVASELVRLFQLGMNGGKIGGEFNVMQQAAFALGEIFRNTIIPVFNDVKEGVRLFGLALSGGQVGGEISKFHKLMFDAGVLLRETVIPAVQAMAKSAMEVASAIGPIIVAVAKWTVESGLLSTALNVAIGLFNLFVSTITTTIDAVKLALDIYDAAKELGAKVIQGFIDGAESMISKVTDIFGKISEAGKKAIDKVWIFGSPSKTARKMGEDIITGFANGLDSWKSKVMVVFDQMHDAAIKKLGGIEGAAKRAAEVFNTMQTSYVKGSEGGGVAPKGSDPTANANARRVASGQGPIGGTLQSFLQGAFSWPNTAARNAGLQEDSAHDVWTTYRGGTPSPNGAMSREAARAWLRRNGIAGFAAGGMYMAGVPRIVGERGWEIDVPSTSGRVMSHEQSKGALGSTINISNITLPNVANAQQFYDELKRIQTRELRLTRAGAG